MHTCLHTTISTSFIIHKCLFNLRHSDFQAMGLFEKMTRKRLEYFQVQYNFKIPDGAYDASSGDHIRLPDGTAHRNKSWQWQIRDLSR